MRMIDADAIQLPKGFFENVDNVPKFYEWLNSLPTVPAAPRWVRCEDELPKVGETVLAWEHGQFAIVDKYCGDGKWGLSDALARYSHWMPLPDAPGGEKE